MEEYADLYQLLSKDYEASQYYSLLPYDVKQALGFKADSILNFDDLHNFAMHCQEEEGQKEAQYGKQSGRSFRGSPGRFAVFSITAARYAGCH